MKGMRGIATTIFVCALFVLVLSPFALAMQGRRVLVLLGDLHIRNTHSSFFRSLEDNGYSLHYEETTSPDLQLAQYGEYSYDNLIIFAPRDEAFNLEVDSILNFIDDGHNVFIAVDGTVSDPVREIASECGVTFGDSDTLVIDHLNFDTSDLDGDHTLIVSESVVNASVITGQVAAPLLFRGIGVSLEKDNQLLIPVLKASSTAFVYAPDAPVTEAPKILGTNTVLIAALQARNNARVTFSGSLEFFSDKFFNSPVQRYQPDSAGHIYPRTGNGPMSAALASWTFGARGVLRASNVRHHRAGEIEAPRIYTIKESLEYHVNLEEWNGTHWIPYTASDVPLEFVRLDPYERVYLQKEGTGSSYHTSFQIPDVYGIFTLRLNYHRLGYTSFADNTKVTVRPLKHNQYERFIFSAYPYYASAFSMMFGLFLFSLFFLYNKDRPRAAKK